MQQYVGGPASKAGEMLGSDPGIRITKFWTEYKPGYDWDEGKQAWKPNGKMREVDMVAYSQVGEASRSLNEKPVKLLLPESDWIPNSANEGLRLAWVRWNTIRPAYEAWKAGNEAPLTGTPLAAWAGVTPQQVEVLKHNGVRTVEELVHLPDAVRDRLPFPGTRALQESAKVFLASADRTKITADMAALEEKNKALEDQLEEMKQILLEMQSAGQKTGKKKADVEKEAA